MTLVWLYAIRPAEDPFPPSARGVDDEEPRLVVEGSLAAVVGSVADERFDEDALAAVMEDLPRLGALARRHHAVVLDAGRSGGGAPVAPVRLATVYRDDDAVRRLLRERSDQLAGMLERLRGRREWGVKVYRDATAPAVGPSSDEEATPPGRPGTAYLLRRRSERDRTARGRAHAREVADRLHAALAARAEGDQRLALQDSRLSGRAHEMVLNATYLVDEAGETEFRAALDAADTDGVEVELTGPWPPFSFTSWEEP